MIAFPVACWYVLILSFECILRWCCWKLDDVSALSSTISAPFNNSNINSKTIASNRNSTAWLLTVIILWCNYSMVELESSSCEMKPGWDKKEFSIHQDEGAPISNDEIRAGTILQINTSLTASLFLHKSIHWLKLQVH